ncbi:hypothetical protein [uncultured Roseobacter sp.]|uniref:hypothetical protein n=1 Tax=uncultured Roseobacter sp. TaxID=114847 RepID=UPI002618E3F3|nr:hypothetical protein [uncultured Roseobacter sp.]
MSANNEPKRMTPWVEFRDVLCVAGVGLIGYGAWLIEPAYGFIAPGVILTGISVFGVRT